MITNQQLRATFLTPNMKYYFEKKFPHLSSEEVDMYLEELLKYLNMAVYCNGDIPFSKEVDEFWHYWILETEEYQDLCNKLHGKKFFHHSSNDYEEFSNKDAKSRKIEVNRGIEILVSYVLNYGDFEEDRIKHWPFTTKIIEQFGWSLREFNAWLRSGFENSGAQLISTLQPER
ncbi:MAG: hypothetical protein V3U75_11505 [Methylococcaceae bacterium]